MRANQSFRFPWLRTGIQLLAVLALIAGLLGFTTLQSQAAVPIPVFSITAVEKDNLVTIKTDNFPANKTFVVRMGKFGTLGVGGTEVATTFSGAGGSFTASYTIPAALKGLDRLAIRLDATSGGYYSYNWFWNNTGAVSTTSTPVPTTSTPVSTTTPAVTQTPVPAVPIPTFTIQDVVKDNNVTIKTANFPANKTFTARMGKYGTLGIDGVVVGITNSGEGGVFAVSYPIPDTLKGEARIHLRLESTTGGYYSYNWFWNNSTTATPVTTTPVSGGTVYTGIPTIKINSVVKDDSVSITTNNFPKSRTFTVRMGKFGTLAIGGIDVGSLISDAGGAIDATFLIPTELKGQSLIAIRLDSTTGGFYSYGWFWNH